MSLHINYSDPDCAIEIERSKEFIHLATELGNYNQDLPLTNYQNDELIRLTVEQVKEAEAFKHGLKMGLYNGKGFGGDQ
ncbi:hypothetical protein [Acetobacterium bakii]|uniref:Uncharacterized protein n=1 Tax=Acetobacterium bakii TaxID=52689 RepID=A0A0L6TZF3_9FIRM|nr:hypothetical protein [Acetobacterium bakii]KNZ41452.1 hypothetical protein AKG39_11830 [Acetobacterium bakii]